MSQPPSGHSGILLHYPRWDSSDPCVTCIRRVCVLHFARLGVSEMQKHGYGLAASRGDIAVALHEWYTALAIADASVEAEIYHCAIDLVMEYLEPCVTVHDLLDSYYCPEIALLQIMKELCTGGEILLQPRVLLRASHAMWLRHLVGKVVA